MPLVCRSRCIVMLSVRDGLQVPYATVLLESTATTRYMHPEP